MASQRAAVRKDTRVQDDRMADTAAESKREFIDRVREELEPELTVIRPLGRSAVAEVFLARERELRRLVAVKVLAPGLANDRKAVLRFEREAQSAARIAHPNVVTVYRVGRLSDGLPYLVMRYVKGRGLGDLLRAEGPFDRGRACEILGAVASAVAAGHRRHVVHRDVKPANVLIDGTTGDVVVVDFGIAAILVSGEEEPERITTAGHIVGDPQYMSPERLLGELPDERSDVYNLGLLGYELLAGRGPFEADTNRGWTEAHLNEEPPPLSRLRPGTDSRVDELLLRCLAKNPDHRPNAVDFEQAIASLCGRAEAARPRAAAAGSAPTGSAPPAASPAPAALSASTPAPPPQAPAPGLLNPARGHRFRYDALGGLDLFNLEEDGRVLSIVAQPKRVALLTYLAVGADEPYKRRERIASIFWPEHDEDAGRHALRQALYVLRGSLGSETIIGRGDDEIGIDPDLFWSDVVAFERAIATDRPDVAMELYRGQLLPGFYLNDVIDFEHWLDNERNRLERLATEAAWTLASRREKAGDGAAALHWGRRAADLAPFDESLLRRLLELHLRLGDRAGALNAYENFARRLREELEAEPMAQTVALAERVRSG
ncbi:MAG TPA: protein kinase [Gemmatimonadota bacterium]|nr:protein kinase [Gemmatimonadota bacterium]